MNHKQILERMTHEERADFIREAVFCLPQEKTKEWLRALDVLADESITRIENLVTLMAANSSARVD